MLPATQGNDGRIQDSRGWETAQSVECLLCKPADLSSSPSIHDKRWVDYRDSAAQLTQLNWVK